MSELNFNKMVLKLVSVMFLLFSASLSLPLPKTKYDQRQEGEMNIRADLDNILVLFVHSGGIRLVDDQQIGSILQIFGNSRKNPPVSDGSNKESPYKVEIQQSAIEKLQSDVDSLNTILPISKNYNNIEKKESIDSEQQTVTKTEDNKNQETTTSGLPSSISDTSTTTMPTKVTPEITTSETIITSVPIQKTSEKMSTEKEKTSQTLPQPATSVTVISPKPSPSDDAASIASKIHQKIIQTSTSKNHQSKSSSASQIQPARSSSATVSSKTSKFLNIEEQRREEQLKSLRSGLVHCLPGQRLTEDGDCVEIQPTRESRQEKMERLLSLLRFGVQPANNNH